MQRKYAAYYRELTFSSEIRHYSSIVPIVARPVIVPIDGVTVAPRQQRESISLAADPAAPRGKQTA